MKTLPYVTIEDIEKLEGKWFVEKSKFLAKIIDISISLENCTKMYLSPDIIASLTLVDKMTYDKNKEYYKGNYFCGYYNNSIEVYSDLDSVGIRFE